MEVNRLRITDVYEIAKNIAKQFQEVISEYGSHSVSAVIPMVIEALEHLEFYVENYEKLQTERARLALVNEGLHRNCRAKSEEYEGLVQQWENQKKEKRGMLKHISRLQLSRSDLLQTLQSISGSPLMGGGGGGGGGVRETSFSSSVHEEELSNGAPTTEMAELQRNIENLSSECREKEGELLDREDFLVSMLQEVKKCQRKDSMCDDIEMVDGATGGSTSLAAVAMELERTKSELEDVRKALMRLEEDNQNLRKKFDEMRAEAALDRLSVSVNRSVSDTPKFYKEDLLSLLQDKQEMKEEVIALREETAFLKRKLQRSTANASVVTATEQLDPGGGQGWWSYDSDTSRCTPLSADTLSNGTTTPPPPPPHPHTSTFTTSTPSSSSSSQSSTRSSVHSNSVSSPRSTTARSISPTIPATYRNRIMHTVTICTPV